MANVKQGTLAAPAQRWKHMDFWKRIFWKQERRAHKAAILAQADEPVIRTDGGSMSMHEMYGDGSAHEACQDCGRCRRCGDCICR